MSEWTGSDMTYLQERNWYSDVMTFIFTRHVCVQKNMATLVNIDRHRASCKLRIKGLEVRDSDDRRQTSQL